MAKFDPDNPPKFCPKCQKMGISTKVKMRRLCPDYEKVLICKHDQVRYIFSSFDKKCDGGAPLFSVPGPSPWRS